MRLMRKILDKIKEHGQIRFYDFMEQALYDHEFGYYTNAVNQISADGDFITAPTIGSLFGTILSCTIEHYFISIGCRNIIEYGAGTGALAKSILANIKVDQYFIVEKSPSLIAKQQEELKDLLSYDKITWIAEIPNDFNGVIIANEVLDAFSVIKFRWLNKKLYEYFVTEENSNLKFVVDEPSDALNFFFDKYCIKDFINDYDDYTSELNPGIYNWIVNLDKKASNSAVIVCDYGVYANDYYSLDKNNGTLRGYMQHKIYNDVLLEPGNMDLTAHVDFSSLLTSCADTRFESVEFTTLGNYIINTMVSNPQLIDNVDPAELKFLTMPNKMGDIFKLMVLYK